MLSLKIRNPKAPPRTEPEPDSSEAFMDKKAILGRHLNKCFLKVGDRVRFKKPKRKPIYGTLIHAEEDPMKVEWRNQGTIPLFLTVEVDKVNRHGEIYGTEKQRVGVKQLLFVHSR